MPPCQPPEKAGRWGRFWELTTPPDRLVIFWVYRESKGLPGSRKAEPLEPGRQRNSPRTLALLSARGLPEKAWTKGEVSDTVTGNGGPWEI